MTPAGPRWLAAAWLILVMATVAAGQPSVSGFMALDVQGFTDPPTFPQQDTNQIQPSLLLQPEFTYDWRNDRLTVVPMARLDFTDERRRHVDLREFNWLHAAPTWDLLVGVGKVFWGVTGSAPSGGRHQPDGPPGGPGRRGQAGSTHAAAVPGAGLGHTDVLCPALFPRATGFPAKKGRLRAGLMVDTDHAQFESSLKEWHPDVAARWTHALGDWDVAVGYFRGTSRAPRLTLDIGDDGQPRLIPVYDQIDQASLELQWTIEAWLWKLEAISRWGHGKHFSAVVAGFEYSFFSLFGTALDLGIVAEYLYDDRSAAAPGTPFENDVFVGGRLAFNDVGSTSILAGAIVDDHTGAALVTIEASRRLGDRWTIELESTSFFDVPPTALLYSVRRDDYVQLRLSRFF